MVYPQISKVCHFAGQNRQYSRDGARGGLERDIAPPLEHASSRRKVKSDFSEIFGIYSTLKTIF